MDRGSGRAFLRWPQIPSWSIAGCQTSAAFRVSGVKCPLPIVISRQPTAICRLYVSAVICQPSGIEVPVSRGKYWVNGKKEQRVTADASMHRTWESAPRSEEKDRTTSDGSFSAPINTYLSAVGAVEPNYILCSYYALLFVSFVFYAILCPVLTCALCPCSLSPVTRSILRTSSFSRNYMRHVLARQDFLCDCSSPESSRSLNPSASPAPHA